MDPKPSLHGVIGRRVMWNDPYIHARKSFLGQSVHPVHVQRVDFIGRKSVFRVIREHHSGSCVYRTSFYEWVWMRTRQRYGTLPVMSVNLRTKPAKYRMAIRIATSAICPAPFRTRVRPLATWIAIRILLPTKVVLRGLS